MAGEPTDATPAAGTPVPTLGERLTEQGHALADRHLTAFPWSGPLAVATQRAAALGTAHDGRFTRVEVDTHDRRPVRPSATRPGGPASPIAVPGAPARSVPAAIGSRPVLPVASPEPGPPAQTARGRPLEPGVRDRLHTGVGPAADMVRVHEDPAADALARSHGADAVTIGTDVHFREGRYRPGEEHAFGLLVHEVGHVQAAIAPGASVRRATGAGRAEEEQRVVALEQAAVTDARGSRAAGGTSSGTAPTLPAQAGHHAVVTPTTAPVDATPMAAPTGRDVGAAAPPGGASAPLQAGQLAALRRELVEHVLGDLRRRLRTEFERGG